jgi:hypothetical protein
MSVDRAARTDGGPKNVGNMRFIFRRPDIPGIIFNIQFVPHSEFILIHLKRAIDECHTRKIIAVYC